MLSAEVLRAGTRLKWVQALGTGVDNLTDQPALRKDIIVTNIHGIHGRRCRKRPSRTMLALARNLPRRGARPRTRGNGGAFRRSFCTTRPSGFSASAPSPKRWRQNARPSACASIGVSSAPRPVAGFDRDACPRRAVAGGGRVRFLRAADAAHRNDPQQHRCEGIRGDEADELSGQPGARRRSRRAGADRSAQVRQDRRRGARRVQRGAAAPRSSVLGA